MRCRKARIDISRSVDGELQERENDRLERHLAACDECRALREDLRTIVAGAAGLGTPEPSDRVWLKIRAGLAAGAVSPAAASAGRGPRLLPAMGGPAVRWAGAAALAAALVITGVVVGLRLGRSTGPAGMTSSESSTLAKLDEAERYYEQAIRSLSEAFAAGKGGLPPQIIELFDRNLSVIDATIQACRQAVLEEPDDLEARNYLLAAYTRKVTLLDSGLDLQRRGQDAPAAKKII